MAGEPKSNPSQHQRHDIALVEQGRFYLSTQPIPPFAATLIASGDFGRVILENIAARAHFLVLLTPSREPKGYSCGDN